MTEIVDEYFREFLQEKFQQIENDNNKKKSDNERVEEYFREYLTDKYKEIKLAKETNDEKNREIKIVSKSSNSASLDPQDSGRNDLDESRQTEVNEDPAQTTTVTINPGNKETQSLGKKPVFQFNIKTKDISDIVKLARDEREKTLAVRDKQRNGTKSSGQDGKQTTTDVPSKAPPVPSKDPPVEEKKSTVISSRGIAKSTSDHRSSENDRSSTMRSSSTRRVSESKDIAEKTDDRERRREREKRSRRDSGDRDTSGDDRGSRRRVRSPPTPPPSSRRKEKYSSTLTHSAERHSRDERTKRKKSHDRKNERSSKKSEKHGKSRKKHAAFEGCERQQSEDKEDTSYPSKSSTGKTVNVPQENNQLKTDTSQNAGTAVCQTIEDNSDCLVVKDGPAQLEGRKFQTITSRKDTSKKELTGQSTLKSDPGNTTQKIVSGNTTQKIVSGGNDPGGQKKNVTRTKESTGTILEVSGTMESLKTTEFSETKGTKEVDLVSKDELTTTEGLPSRTIDVPGTKKSDVSGAVEGSEPDSKTPDPDPQTQNTTKLPDMEDGELSNTSSHGKVATSLEPRKPDETEKNKEKKKKSKKRHHKSSRSHKNDRSRSRSRSRSMSPFDLRKRLLSGNRSHRRSRSPERFAGKQRSGDRRSRSRSRGHRSRSRSRDRYGRKYGHFSNSRSRSTSRERDQTTGASTQKGGSMSGPTNPNIVKLQLRGEKKKEPKSRKRPDPHERGPLKKTKSEDESLIFDKAKLLEIAKANLPYIQIGGVLSPRVIAATATADLQARLAQAQALIQQQAPPPPPPEPTPQPQSQRPPQLDMCDKSVNQMIDFCTEIAAGKEHVIHHPFTPIPTPATIGMSRMRMAPPRMSSRMMSSQLAICASTASAAASVLPAQFPVSSGEDHRTSEIKQEQRNNQPQTQTDSAEDDDKISVFPDPSKKPDINKLVTDHMIAQQTLQANPGDVLANLKVARIKNELQTWADTKNTPGRFTGSTGAVKILRPHVFECGYQAWAKKDMFHNLKPVQSDVGIRLMEKMGWKPGEPLGKTILGAPEPLALDVKVDRKGLVSQGETPGRHKMQTGLANQFQGKHPVSALSEFCMKQKAGPPMFELVMESGPPNRKNFLFKVCVNGAEYQSPGPSLNKKDGKANAAAVALKSLGIS